MQSVHELRQRLGDYHANLCIVAGYYITYVLIMICVSLDMSALFRLIGATSPTPTHAQSFGALGILILVLTSGFAIVRSKCILYSQVITDLG